MARRWHGKRQQASTREWVEPFVFTFRAGLRTLAQDRRCTLQDLRVFLWLLGIMEWGNRVRVSQTAIGEALGMSRQNVWVTLQRLMQHGLILPRPKVGARATYQVSTAYAYYGPLASHHRARREEWARQQLEALARAMREDTSEGDILTLVQGLRGVSPVHAR